MEKVSQLNDLDYCYASWELLKDLEKNSYLRNELKRKFQAKANKQQFLGGAILSVTPLLIILGYLVFSNEILDTLPLRRNVSNYGLNLVSLIMVGTVLFILVYMFLGVLWNSSILSPFKEITEKNLKNKLESDIEAVDLKAESILSQSVFKEERIPKQFFCSEMLPLLIRYLESGQATIIKEAVYYLELELMNTGHYDNLIPTVTLVQREKAYLLKKKEKLRKEIEKINEG